MTERDVLRLVVRSALLIALIGLIGWFAWTVRGVLVLFLVSIILATGLSPIVDAISGHGPRRRFLRLPRGLAVLLLYLGLFVGIGLVVLWIIPPLVEQAEDFAEQIPAYTHSAREGLRALEETYPLVQGLDARLIAQVGESLGDITITPSQASSVFRFALGVVSGVLSFLLLLVLTFYLIVDGAQLRRGLLALLPRESRPLAEAVADRVRLKIGAWLIGQMLLSAIIGAATFVGLALLGVPYALLLAVIAAIGELIPMLGPILAAVPAVVVASFVSPLLGLLTLGLYVLVQQVENHVIVPQVMRRAVDLPPVVVIVALLMGSEVLGVVGAILALPVAAAISVVVGELIALRDGRIEAPAEPATAAKVIAGKA